jgi:hypothetical protein
MYKRHDGGEGRHAEGHRVDTSRTPDMRPNNWSSSNVRDPALLLGFRTRLS